MNTIPHIEIVKFIEEQIIKIKPDVVITHYYNDLNPDHRITSECCDEAVRIFERNNDLNSIKKYMYMEVLSATDWTIKEAFRPNYYYEIGVDGLNNKIKALAVYDNVLREFPHPRSEECIRALSVIRSGESGLNYAEAFIIGFERNRLK